MEKAGDTHTRLHRLSHEFRRRRPEGDDPAGANPGTVAGSSGTENRAGECSDPGETCRILVEYMNEGALALAPDGRILYGNRRMEEMTQRSFEDLVGSYLCRLLVPEDSPACRELQSDAPDGAKGEVTLLRADGSRLPVLLSVRQLELREGAMVVAVVTDLSEQKQVERRLRDASESLEARVRERTAELEAANTELQREIGERLRAEEERELLLQVAECARAEAETWAAALARSEALYRGIGESIPCGIWVASPEGRIEYLSESFLQMAGKTLDECSGYGWTACLASGDVRQMAIAWRQCGESGDIWRREYRIRGADGRCHTIMSCGVPIRDDAGQISRWAGVNLDITAEKEAEDRLRESEERFRQLADNIDVAFWIKERLAPTLLYVNPAIEAMWGIPREVLMQDFMSYLDRVHPEDRERVRAAHLRMAEDIEQGRPAFCQEYRILREDGTARWMISHAFPVFDDRGQPYRVSGITEDITDRKEVEEQLRRYSEELEALVEERTRRVRELERQRVMMEQLAAAGRMAARVAHDINNPLAGIKNAFLLLKDAIPETHKYARYVPRIEEEIARIAGIVRQMFELCRPQEGVEERLPCAKVLQDVVALHDLACRKRGVTLSVALDPPCADVPLPEHSLRQVLYNVLQNAVDASPQGGHIEVAVDMVPGPAIRFSVRDQGAGIPENRQPYIFEPFYSTRFPHRASGLGLGLPISHTLVENLGGTITFHSVPNQGTTFVVTLPIESAG
jgi:PAS domain S-box-containing protein